MASTYSALKIELIGTGEQSGQWGDTTNVNLGFGGAGLEQAIVGMATLVTGDFTANVYTLPYDNTNTVQDFRALVLNITATLSGAGEVIVPAIQKPYIILNNSVGGYAVTVKVTGQTGVSVPNGKSMWVFNNGTNVVEVVTHAGSLSVGSLSTNSLSLTSPLAISSGGTGTASTTFANLTTNVTGTLPVANGGTGAATLTSNNVILGNGTSAVQFVAPGTVGNFLISNGTTWTSAAAASVLVGTVTWFATNTAPTGYLKANGAVVSRTIYADLFAAIGTTFGAGDGSTTFGLPDLRGEFIRGWDDGRGVDSGRAFGSAQLDQMQQITGTIGTTNRSANGAILANQTSSGALSYGGSQLLNSAGNSSPATGNSEIVLDSANSPSARTGSETRPRNIALLACIKF